MPAGTKWQKTLPELVKTLSWLSRPPDPNPDTNPALRRCYVNAKSCNMPKDKIEAAIKRALGKDTSNYEEIVYEGYAPHGVAVLVEAATDNPTRTVANVRMHYSKNGGTMGSTGSVAFTFTRMGEFKFKKASHNIEELELELIDFGLEEIGEDAEGNMVVRTSFTEFGP